MILTKAKKIIYLNAGHYDDPVTSYLDNPGAVFLKYIEYNENIKVRDALIPKLEKLGFIVKKVPDSLTLRKSIDWVNKHAKNLQDGLAFSIHFNYLSDQRQGGTESFYGTSSITKQIGALISKKVSSALSIKNRGAKPDTMSAPRELGWLRQTNCWASLLEVCFLTNKKDMTAYNTIGYDKVATAISEALAEIFGIKIKKDGSCAIDRVKIEKLEKENSMLRQVISQLISHISSFFKRK